jgi:hypothetical protein
MSRLRVSNPTWTARRFWKSAQEQTGADEKDERDRDLRNQDISIWDPHYIAKREHRKQKVLCAAELALNQCSIGNPHTINDATKLAGATNEIRYGYLLFFVRDDPVYERNEQEIWANLEDAATRVRVVFARVDGQSKPKPKFLGSWGVV